MEGPELAAQTSNVQRLQNDDLNRNHTELTPHSQFQKQNIWEFKIRIY